MQRVVILSGNDSTLLYGDPDLADDRYKVFDGASIEHGAALPVLLAAGWQIESVTSAGNTAIVVLKGGGNGSASDERGQR